MITTIKLAKETKERILSLDLAEKGKSFDMIINDLITSYKNTKKDYIENNKKWKKSFEDYEDEVKVYQKNLKEYKKQKDLWERLLKWAKSEGFKY